MTKATLHRWLPLLPVLLLCLAAYSGNGGFQFIDEWDDRLYILSNPQVTTGLSMANLYWAATTFHACNWHPLTWISLMGDVSLFGVDPRGFHYTAVALHLINTGLVYTFILYAFRTPWTGALIAGLFALHPLHVESVSWISERKDLLSALFWFASMIAYTLYAQKGGWHRYGLVLLFFVLGMLSKQMLVTLPFVFLLLDYWPLRRLETGFTLRHLGGLVAEKIPFILLSALFAWVIFQAQNQCGAVIKIELLPIVQRVENALVTYVTYLWLLIWPEKLAFFYPHPKGLPGWQPAAAALFLSGVTALTLHWSRIRPWLLVGWLFYLGTLLPVIGLVQIGPQAFANRYTYISFLGLFIMLAFTLNSLSWNRFGRLAVSALLGALLLVLAITTHWQAHWWQNRETLYTRALQVTERNYLAHAQLASNFEQLNRLDEAQHHANLALEYDEKSVPAHITMGNIQRKLKNHTMARDHYLAAIQLMPNASIAYYNLGILDFEQNRFPEALEHYGKALQYATKESRVFDNIGVTLFAMGRVEEALANFQKAVEYNPNSFNAQFNMARAMEYLQRYQEALPHYQQALALDPSQERAHWFYAKLLHRLGQPDKARAALAQLLQLNPNHPEATNLLRQIQP